MTANSPITTYQGCQQIPKVRSLIDLAPNQTRHKQIETSEPIKQDVLGLAVDENSGTNSQHPGSNGTIEMLPTSKSSQVGGQLKANYYLV